MNSATEAKQVAHTPGPHGSDYWRGVRGQRKAKPRESGRAAGSLKPNAELIHGPKGILDPSRDRRSGKHVGDAEAVLAHGRNTGRKRSVADNGPQNELAGPEILTSHQYSGRHAVLSKAGAA